MWQKLKHGLSTAEKAASTFLEDKLSNTVPTAPVVPPAPDATAGKTAAPPPPSGTDTGGLFSGGLSGLLSPAIQEAKQLANKAIHQIQEIGDREIENARKASLSVTERTTYTVAGGLLGAALYSSSPLLGGGVGLIVGWFVLPSVL